MPVFHYKPASGRCKLCGEGFDHSQTTAEASLISCPKCGQDVVRDDVHSVHTPNLLKPLSISDAKQKGFTVLKRVGKGEFEKQ